MKWIKLAGVMVFLSAMLCSTSLQAQEGKDSCRWTKEEILSMSYDSLLELPMETVVKLARIAGLSVDELFNMLVSTAGNKEEKVSEVPASVVVITRHDIENFGYASLAEILEHVPGLYPINNLSFYGTSFGVRGFWADQENSNLVIMIDGVKQTFEFFGSNPITKVDVPVEAIERIEIIRGPMSVIYGSGAFFGAINIITQPQEQQSEARASVAYGSMNTLKTYLGVKQFSEESGFRINAGWERSDGMDVPLNRMTTRNYAPFGYTSTEGRLSESRKFFSLAGRWKDINGQMTYMESRQGGYLFQPSGREGSISDLRSTSFSLNYSREISRQWKFEGKFRYQHDWVNNDLDRDWAWRLPDSSLHIIADIYEYDQFSNNTIDAEAISFYKPLRSLSVMAGISYRGVTELHYTNDHPVYMIPIYYNADWYLTNPAGITNLSPYLQFQYSPVEKLKLTAGLRLQYVPDFDFTIRYAFDTVAFKDPYFTNKYLNYSFHPDKFELVPRLAAIYSINDDHILKFLYGKAMKNPSFESVTDACTRGFQVGPEYINTFEINYAGKISSTLKTGISGFVNILDDLIVRQMLVEYLPHDTNYYSVLDNGANRRSIGAELTLGWNPLPALSAQFAATYQKTVSIAGKDQSSQGSTNPGSPIQGMYPDSLPVSYSPPLLMYANLSWKPLRTITLSAAATYVDKMVTGWDPLRLNKNGSIGAFYGQESKPWFNLDVNVRWDPVLKSRFYSNLHVSNLLNSTQYYPTTNFSSWAQKGTLRPGRTLLFSIGLKF